MLSVKGKKNANEPTAWRCVKRDSVDSTATDFTTAFPYEGKENEPIHARRSQELLMSVRYL